MFLDTGLTMSPNSNRLIVKTINLNASFVFAGIGCYVPKADEHIILRFNIWKSENDE